MKKHVPFIGVFTAAILAACSSGSPQEENLQQVDLALSTITTDGDGIGVTGTIVVYDSSDNSVVMSSTQNAAMLGNTTLSVALAEGDYYLVWQSPVCYVDSSGPGVPLDWELIADSTDPKWVGYIDCEFIDTPPATFTIEQGLLAQPTMSFQLNRQDAPAVIASSASVAELSLDPDFDEVVLCGGVECVGTEECVNIDGGGDICAEMCDGIGDVECPASTICTLIGPSGMAITPSMGSYYCLPTE